MQCISIEKAICIFCEDKDATDLLLIVPKNM
jgi:hypothetical protein